VLAGGGVDLRHLLDILDRLVGHLVGLAELALHHDEDRLHRAALLPLPNVDVALPSACGCVAQSASHQVTAAFMAKRGSRQSSSPSRAKRSICAWALVRIRSMSASSSRSNASSSAVIASSEGVPESARLFPCAGR